MCGITGFAGQQFGRERSEVILRAMCGAIRHRGPDDEGRYVADDVAIGMRRLSIIDVAGGHQPMGNEDESVNVVFNGEIYNHRLLRDELARHGHSFRTHSDTETIVHGYEEWGTAVFEHLRGMFAIAIWDSRLSRLVLARDRLGIKPLYYQRMGGGIAFGSELRSLLHLPGFSAELDDTAIAWYLALGYIPEPHCVFQGVSKLEPGHFLIWSADQGESPSQPVQFWNPLRPEIRISELEAIEELRRLLGEAVASHLESEVPLGAFLSGGLDSSTVVALMTRQAGETVRTFSIGFEDAGFNEAPDARLVADALGTDHTELIVRPDADTLIDGLIPLFDEPFADSSALPTYIVAELARQQVTVALSGDGGDELFAGYTRYAETIDGKSVPRAVGPLLGAIGRNLPQGAFGRNRIINLGRGAQGRYATTVAEPLRVDEGGVARSHIAARLRAHENLLDPWWSRGSARDPVTQMTLVDMQTYLPGDILTKVDRTSMAVSLEARVPLLDHPLVEFAVSLPGSFKLRDGTGKWIFRRAIETIVPEGVLTRPKRGFAVPLARWFRGPLRHRLDELGRTSSPIYRWAEPDAVARLLAEHSSGRRDHSHQLWRLLALSLWLEHLARGTLHQPNARLQPVAVAAS